MSMLYTRGPPPGCGGFCGFLLESRFARGHPPGERCLLLSFCFLSLCHISSGIVCRKWGIMRCVFVMEGKNAKTVSPPWTVKTFTGVKKYAIFICSALPRTGPRRRRLPRHCPTKSACRKRLPRIPAADAGSAAGRCRSR